MTLAAEQDRLDVAERHWLWKFWQAQLHPFHLVFLDDIIVNTKMTRHHGRAFQGKRVASKVSAGHWKTTTFACKQLFCLGLSAELLFHRCNPSS